MRPVGGGNRVGHDSIQSFLGDMGLRAEMRGGRRHPRAYDPASRWTSVALEAVRGTLRVRNLLVPQFVSSITPLPCSAASRRKEGRYAPQAEALAGSALVGTSRVWGCSPSHVRAAPRPDGGPKVEGQVAVSRAIAT